MNEKKVKDRVEVKKSIRDKVCELFIACDENEASVKLDYSSSGEGTLEIEITGFAERDPRFSESAWELHFLEGLLDSAIKFTKEESRSAIREYLRREAHSLG